MVRYLGHGTILVRQGTILLPMVRFSAVLVPKLVPNPKSYLNKKKMTAGLGPNQPLGIQIKSNHRKGFGVLGQNLNEGEIFYVLNLKNRF